MNCEHCHGWGVVWKNEETCTGGRDYKRGWFEKCLACDGEGLKDEKRVAKRIEFCVGQSLSLHEKMIPDNFGLNTPENQAWKIGGEKLRANANESVWLASNGMLLIVHGDGGWHPDIKARQELDQTPTVEAKYYAWLNPGVFTGKYVGLLIEALEEWNSLAPAAEVVSK